MKTKHLMAITTVILLGAGVVGAQDATSDRVVREEAVRAYYPDHELSLDLAGTYSDRDRYGGKTGQLGGGLGLDWFFTRNIGIGADTYLEEGRWPYRANGSLLLRLPIAESPFALYALGGGGREFRYVPQYTYHGGAGVEFRFNPSIGIFADARRVFPDRTGDYTLARVGLRFLF